MVKSLLLVFVKYPVPGQVKTRLAADLGAEAATEVYREMVTRVLQRIPRRQAVRVVFDGRQAEADYRAWLANDLGKEAEFRAQAEGDLGRRLENAFAEAFADGWQAVGVIGSDCLELNEEIYEDAWGKLRAADLVIGPSHDGGYYFLALKKPAPSLFADISWSTEKVFEQTLCAAVGAGLVSLELTKLHDVDTLADWERARAAGGPG